MGVDPRLDILPQFQIRAIGLETEAALITGIFSRVHGIAVDDRGWLFVSEMESSIADIVMLDGNVAVLDVPDWALTRHVCEGATLPWLDAYWQAGDVAFLLDGTKDWRRVRYQATDAIVFAKKTILCPTCGWTCSGAAPLMPCRKCSSALEEREIFGDQEAFFPLEAGERFVETRTGFWDHDHCLICDFSIGRERSWGYREAAFAGGPNSVGIWLCEACFDRYVRQSDFSFLVRRSISG